MTEERWKKKKILELQIEILSNTEFVTTSRWLHSASKVRMWNTHWNSPFAPQLLLKFVYLCQGYTSVPWLPCIQTNTRLPIGTTERKFWWFLCFLWFTFWAKKKQWQRANDSLINIRPTTKDFLFIFFLIEKATKEVFKPLPCHTAFQSI